jgi:LysM repeat protein
MRRLLKASVIFIILATSLAGLAPVAAQQPTTTPQPYDPERDFNITRLVGDSEFVVSLFPDGKLDFYEIKDGVGVFLGSTAPGWRDDTRGAGLIDRHVGPDGFSATLESLGGGSYAATLFDASGSRAVRRIFTGQGPTAQEVASSAGTVVTTTTTTTATTTTVTAGIGDNGSMVYATGTVVNNVYFVARGDHLYRIALRFNTTLGALQALNYIPNVNYIQEGQAIRIQ